MVENNTSGMNSKTMGIVTYLTIIGWIVALVLNQNTKSPYVSFHLRQMIGIVLTGVVISFVNWIPFIGWFIGLVGGIFVFVLWLIGFLAALNGEQKLVPILGDKYQEMFSGVN